MGELLGLLLGLLGIIVTGVVSVLALWLQYKSRAAGHREHFYEKQVETYKDMVEILSELYSSVVVFLSMHDMAVHANRIAFREQNEAIVDRCNQKYSSWSLFVTLPIHRRFGEFLGLIISIFRISDLPELPVEMLPVPDLCSAVQQSYWQLMGAMRDAIGANPLLEEIGAVIGRVRFPAHIEEVAEDVPTGLKVKSKKYTPLQREPL